MIQSIQASTTTLYNAAQSTAVTGKVTTSNKELNSQNEQEDDENTTVSSQGDMLTISTQGSLAAKTFTGQSASRPSVDGTGEDSYTDSTATALASAASDAGINDMTAVKNANAADAAAVSGSSSASSSSSEESSLAQYSEAQLKEMLNEGEITQAEYNAEIKSREQSETDEDEDENSTAVSDANQTEA
jgi:hypothetical protein